MSNLYCSRPQASLGRSTLMASLMGLGGLVVLSAWGSSAGLLGRGFAIRAALTYAMGMIVAIRAVEGGHPFATFGPANGVTCARLALVALLAGAIAEPVTRPIANLAALVGAVALALDGLDGWLARRTRMTSPFGARFDMETDALLTLVLAALVWRSDRAGAWVLLSGLLRYLFVGSATLWPWLRHPLPERRRRKAVCAVQVGTLSVALLPALPPGYSTALALAGLAALVISFAIDILWLYRQERVDDRLTTRTRREASA